jgi:hypothetical protein
LGFITAAGGFVGGGFFWTFHENIRDYFSPAAKALPVFSDHHAAMCFL